MKRLTAFEKLLLGWFVFIACLIACRIYFSGSLLFVFLIWNIFLAWVPFFISSRLNHTAAKKWKQYVLFFTWLLFFPNSLYIITDLIHISHETDVPKWFDAILIFSSSIVGLQLAFVSLYRVEKFLHAIAGKRMVAVLLPVILSLGSFGVYLGRFLRWNSWDIISNPVPLLVSVTERILYPFHHLQTWGITIILTALFYLMYFSAKKLPGYLSRANH